MNLQRTPIREVDIVAESPVQASNASVMESMCQICNEKMEGRIPCLLIGRCNHIFHRACIENRLATQAACPICQLSCELSDLQKVNLPMPQGAKPKGKPRGGLAKHYQTRSLSGKFLQESENPLLSISGSDAQLSGSSAHNPPQSPRITDQHIQQTNNFTAQNVNKSPNISVPYNPSTMNRLNQQLVQVNDAPNPNDGRSTATPSVLAPQIGYHDLDKLIALNVHKALQNLNLTINDSTRDHISTNSNNANNLINTHGTFTSSNREFRTQFANNNGGIPLPNNNSNNNQPTSFTVEQLFANYNNENNVNHIPNIHSYRTNSNPSPSSAISYSPEKITSIIQNWGLKFDGSLSGLSVEEFLYRLKSLTNDYFNGNFNVVTKNLHILLTDKARNWFWRYHKQNEVIIWNNFCEAIKMQYKDCKSSFDIREEIRNRKQKPGETFDQFYESILTIADRLSYPLTEMEMIEMITRNLRTEIRHELLYISVNSISELRKLVQRRESFVSDEYVRRNFPARNPNFCMPRGKVSELNIDNDADAVEGQEFLVEAIHKNEIKPLCWNCDREGHFWEDCLRAKSIFCYGCGAKDTYKPQCPKCIARATSKNERLRTHPKQEL